MSDGQREIARLCGQGRLRVITDDRKGKHISISIRAAIGGQSVRYLPRSLLASYLPRCRPRFRTVSNLTSGAR